MIIQLLLEKYQVTPYANDINTGETALHIACKIKSPLRFYITCQCPDLIFAVDIAGEQPLHVACKNNDVEYVTWLFQVVIEEMERNLSVSTPVASQPSVISQSGNTITRTSLTRLSSYTPSLTESSYRKLSLQTDTQSGHSTDNHDLSLSSNQSSSTDQSLSSSTTQSLNETTTTVDDSCIISTSLNETSSEISTAANDSGIMSDNCRHQPVANMEPRTVVFSKDRSTKSSNRESSVSSGTASSDLSNALPQDDKPLIEPVSSPNNLTRTNSFWLSAEMSTFLDSTNYLLRNATSSYGRSPFDSEIVLTVHMRLFALNTSGSSILHIIAKNGYHELLQLILQVAKHLEHNPDGADIEVLIRRESSATPIDEAINSNQPKCLQLLLDFAEDTPIIEGIYNDTQLLVNATDAETDDCLRVLLSKGLWKGLKTALVSAIKKQNHSLVRMLLFYYTQVTSATENSRVKSSGVVTMDTGLLQWDGLDLEELKPFWFDDAVFAISTVSHVFQVKTITHPVHQNKELFQMLGNACNEYFASYVWQPQALPSTWSSLSISDINLSNNKLESIPSELFQISTLVSLNLSKNKLRALPSNLDFQSPLYKCRKLTRLDLSSNQLQTLPEDLFFVLGSNLEEFNAQNNQIESLPPALWVCTRLHTLLLGHNRLSQLHYFSNIKYFYDQDYSRNLINSLHVERGVPLNSGKASEEDFMEIMNYVTRLSVFHQTVSNLLPTALLEQHKMQHDLIQQVIDIHWLRSKLDQATSLDYFDVNLPHDEDLVLTHLDLSQNQFTEFPWDLPCIAPNLEKLDLRGNMIQSVNLLNDIPANVESIILAENKLTTVTRKRPACPCANPINLLTGYVINPKIRGNCKHCTHCILDKVTNMILNDNQIVSFPCVSSREESPKLLTAGLEKYKRQSFYPNLSVLSLDRNLLEAVPIGVQHLTQLSSLSLSHNISITHLPPEMGLMNPQVLLVLKLDGVFPKNIDPKLISKPGTRAILTYLKSLYHK